MNQLGNDTRVMHLQADWKDCPGNRAICPTAPTDYSYLAVSNTLQNPGKFSGAIH